MSKTIWITREKPEEQEGWVGDILHKKTRNRVVLLYRKHLEKYGISYATVKQLLWTTKKKRKLIGRSLDLCLLFFLEDNRCKTKSKADGSKHFFIFTYGCKEFLRVLASPWLTVESTDSKIMKSGFKACGIHLFDQEESDVLWASIY